MKERIHIVLGLLTLLVLGLSAGSMLGEQQTLVPFWKELSTEAFYTWYSSNSLRLKGFFAPMQISGAVLALIVAVTFYIQGRSGKVWMGLSACFALGVLVLFFLFFKETNAGFVARSFSSEQLPLVLEQWSTWQWTRIGFGTVAFIAALMGFYQAKNSLSVEAS